MDSDVSTDQGSLPIHGIRDVGRTADNRKQHDWSTLAEAPEVNTLLADPVTSYNFFNWESSEIKPAIACTVFMYVLSLIIYVRPML